jgi:hypothetical protein
MSSFTPAALLPEIVAKVDMRTQRSFTGVYCGRIKVKDGIKGRTKKLIDRHYYSDNLFILNDFLKYKILPNNFQVN